MRVLKESGYTVKDACAALGVSRSGYYSSLRVKRVVGAKGKVGKDRELLEKIQAIKTEHPFWGYRRVRAWLVHREKMGVNEKRVRRVMRENGLLVSQRVHKAKRTCQRSKPRAQRPRQYWGIDMTKFMISSLGWVYLIIVLDWFTKKIVGWDLSLRGRSKEWKRALEVGLQREFPYGVKGCGLKLISDNGSQPTSVSFMRDMRTLGIEQIFTSYDNPKGNADTERMMRTIKEEIIWLHEFSSISEAREKIGHWIELDYNKFYVHSELGYRSPEEFEAQCYEQTLKEAA